MRLNNSGSVSARGLSLLFALLLTTSVWGQQMTGSLVGLVSDPSGAVVPKAKITLRNTTSGDTRRTETNSEGY